MKITISEKEVREAVVMWLTAQGCPAIDPKDLELGEEVDLADSEEVYIASFPDGIIPKPKTEGVK